MSVALAGTSEYVQYTVTKLSKIKVPQKDLMTPVQRLMKLRGVRGNGRRRKEKNC